VYEVIKWCFQHATDKVSTQQQKVCKWRTLDFDSKDWRQTWNLDRCSVVSSSVRAEIRTALFSSCSFATQAAALFFPISSSDRKKLPDKSHISTFFTSCMVTDLTPARARFFAAKKGQHTCLI
jgi:hypothetical protein